MAIDKKLIHFKSKDNFMSANGVNGNIDSPTSGSEENGNAEYGQIKGTSIAFVKDSKEIWTHGNLYKSVNWSEIGETTPIEIKGQEKSVEITENGVTEIIPDNGYSYLNKVSVVTNVNNGITPEYWKIDYTNNNAVAAINTLMTYYPSIVANCVIDSTEIVLINPGLVVVGQMTVETGDFSIVKAIKCIPSKCDVVDLSGEFSGLMDYLDNFLQLVVGPVEQYKQVFIPITEEEYHDRSNY